MLSGIFMLGSLGFWILATVVFVLVLASVETESPGYATTLLVLTFCGLAFFGDFNLITVVRHNPSWAVIGILLYLVAGTVWSLGKWWLFVRERLERCKEEKKDFFRTGGRGTLYGAIPSSDPKPTIEELNVKWAGYYARHTGIAKPVAAEHKGKIVLWMAYWPVSMFWVAINDPIKKLFKGIFAKIKTTFQRIADSAYRDVEQEINDIEKSAKKEG